MAKYGLNVNPVLPKNPTDPINQPYLTGSINQSYLTHLTNRSYLPALPTVEPTFDEFEN